MKNCVQCEHYLSITDGYGMCMMDELPIMVIDDYIPTKNYRQCERIVKTADQMLREGWCDGCLGNVYECQRSGICEGYNENEKTI